MNVTLIYFSQTGSTHRVAQAMAGAFRETGHSTRLISLKKDTPQDAMACDLLGIGTPCFFSQAPTGIEAFLAGLMPLDSRQAFVFATSGGAPGRTLSELSKLLRGKGGEIVGGFLTHGEVHDPASCLVGRLPNRPDAEDLARARQFAPTPSGRIRAGRLNLDK